MQIHKACRSGRHHRNHIMSNMCKAHHVLVKISIYTLRPEMQPFNLQLLMLLGRSCAPDCSRISLGGGWAGAGALGPRLWRGIMRPSCAFRRHGALSSACFPSSHRAYMTAAGIVWSVCPDMQPSVTMWTAVRWMPTVALQLSPPGAPLSHDVLVGAPRPQLRGSMKPTCQTPYQEFGRLRRREPRARARVRARPLPVLHAGFTAS